MIRKLFLLLIFCHSLAMAQQNAFVLVDMSASKQNLYPIKLEAKALVYELLTGGYSAANHQGWVVSGFSDTTLAESFRGQALAGNNSWICIMPFGERYRYKTYNIQHMPNFQGSIQGFFNSHYPVTFTDNFTYISVAKNYTAHIAYERNLPDYYMFTVTDGLGDQDNTNSATALDSTENRLNAEWANPSYTQVSKLGILEKSGFKIIVEKVINRRYSNSTPPAVTPAKPVIPESYNINLTSYANGKSKDPVKIDKEDIVVSWACTDCPQGTLFKVNVSGVQGTKSRERPRSNLTGNSTSFRLPSGKYKITVSGEVPNGQQSVSPATTYIEISGGNSGLIFGGLAALLIVGGVLAYLSKKQKERQKDTRRNDGTGSISGNNSARYQDRDTGDKSII